MADMYGAIRSNWFKVKNVDKFTKWFNKSVVFGGDIEVFDDQVGVVAFGGYEQYPNAYPMRPVKGGEDQEEWDLEAFAKAVRKHLLPGEEFRVLAAGNEKLRYVAATHLIVTHDKVTFNDYYEGN